jgi:hypothetical protein
MIVLGEAVAVDLADKLRLSLASDLYHVFRFRLALAIGIGRPRLFLAAHDVNIVDAGRGLN